jgi:hypothetical protein
MRVLVKLDQVLENQQETVGLLRRLVSALGPNVEDIDEVLPRPWETDEELRDMCIQLRDDADFKRKLVCEIIQCQIRGHRPRGHSHYVHNGYAPPYMGGLGRKFDFLKI